MKDINIIKKYYICDNCGKTFNNYLNKLFHKWFTCNGYIHFNFIY